jgi:hypothetical protein
VLNALGIIWVFDDSSTAISLFNEFGTAISVFNDSGTTTVSGDLK